MKRFLILVGGFALSCCFVFSGCSNHSANTSDVRSEERRVGKEC